MVYTASKDRMYNVKIHHYYIEGMNEHGALLRLTDYILSQGGPNLLEELTRTTDDFDKIVQDFMDPCSGAAIYVHPLKNQLPMVWRIFHHDLLVPILTGDVHALLDDPDYAYFAHIQIPKGNFITEAVKEYAGSQNCTTVMSDLITAMCQFPDRVVDLKNDLHAALLHLCGLESAPSYQKLLNLPYLRLYYGNERTIKNYVPVCHAVALVLDTCWPRMMDWYRKRMLDLMTEHTTESRHWEESVLADPSSRAEYSRAAWSYILYLSGALKEALLVEM